MFFSDVALIDNAADRAVEALCADLEARGYQLPDGGQELCETLTAWLVDQAVIKKEDPQRVLRRMGLDAEQQVAGDLAAQTEADTEFALKSAGAAPNAAGVDYRAGRLEKVLEDAEVRRSVLVTGFGLDPGEFSVAVIDSCISSLRRRLADI